jgi:hypothetical protein
MIIAWARCRKRFLLEVVMTHSNSFLSFSLSSDINLLGFLIILLRCEPGRAKRGRVVSGSQALFWQSANGRRVMGERFLRLRRRADTDGQSRASGGTMGKEHNGHGRSLCNSLPRVAPNWLLNFLSQKTYTLFSKEKISDRTDSHQTKSSSLCHAKKTSTKKRPDSNFVKMISPTNDNDRLINSTLHEVVYVWWCYWSKKC